MSVSLPKIGQSAKRLPTSALGHVNNRSDSIRAPLEAFADWLEGEAFVEGVWLPSIDTQVDLRINRVLRPA
jgi:hypothetical protein